MRIIKGLFGGIGIGLCVAIAVFILAMALDLVACFFTCNEMSCFSYDSCSSQIWSDIWDGFDGVIMVGSFCGIAGGIIGLIYGFARLIQDGVLISTKKHNELEKKVNTLFDDIKVKKKYMDHVIVNMDKALNSLYKSSKARSSVRNADSLMYNSIGDFDSAIALFNKASKIRGKEALKKALNMVEEVKELLIEPYEKFKNIEKLLIQSEKEEEDIKWAIKRGYNILDDIKKIHVNNTEYFKNINNAKTSNKSNVPIKHANVTMQEIKNILTQSKKLCTDNESLDTEEAINLQNEEINKLCELAKEKSKGIEELLEHANSEEKDLLNIYNKSDELLKQANDTFHKIESELKDHKQTKYYTNSAKVYIDEIKVVVKKLENSINEVIKYAGSVKKCKNSDEAQQIIFQANNEIKSVIELSKDIENKFIVAEENDKKYFRARFQTVLSLIASRVFIGRSLKVAEEVEAAKIDKESIQLHIHSINAEIDSMEKLLTKIDKNLYDVNENADIKTTQLNALNACNVLHEILEKSHKTAATYLTVKEEEKKKESDDKALNGDAEDKYNNATWYIKRQDVGNYIRWLEMSARDGYVVAQKDLGHVLLGEKIQLYDVESKEKPIFIKPVDQIDVDKAIYWLEKAAEQGSIDAEYKLGCVYNYNKEVLDRDKAYKWFISATKHSNIEAFGQLYINDRISKEELVEKFEKLKESADKQSYISMLCVGEIYCSGIGIPRRYSIGVTYLLNGIRMCKHNLSAQFLKRVYEIFNNEKDYERAYIFFDIVSRVNKIIATEYLDDINEKMHDIDEKNKAQRSVESAQDSIDMMNITIEELEKKISEAQHNRDYFMSEYSRCKTELDSDRTPAIGGVEPLSRRSLRESMNRYMAAETKQYEDIQKYNKEVLRLKSRIKTLKKQIEEKKREL